MSELPMLFTPVQAAKIMGVSRSHVYVLMNQGRLSSVNIGRCRRITVGQMNDFIASLTAAAQRLDMCGLIPDNKELLTLPKAEFLKLNLIIRGKSLTPMYFGALV